MAALRALHAAIDGRFADVLAPAAAAALPAPAADGTTVFAGALARSPRARSSGAPGSRRASWPRGPNRAASPATGREACYWIGAALLARGAAPEAHGLVTLALASPAARANPELSWRLAAIARLAAGRRPGSDRDDRLRVVGDEARAHVTTLLGEQAPASLSGATSPSSYSLPVTTAHE